MNIKISNSWTGAVLHECEADSLRSVVTKCVRELGISLRGADLRGADLRGADLCGANLCGADLRGANLRGADLHDADLYSADLHDANLHGADLHDADLGDADLGGADLRDANLYGADLHGANLYGADLRDVRNDFWDVLLRAIPEIPALRAKLVAGEVNGSTYSGECACLVGTIAKIRCVDHRELAGITPDCGRPIESFFMSIKPGDTPEKSQHAKLAVEWIDEFQRSLAAATGA